MRTLSIGCLCLFICLSCKQQDNLGMVLDPLPRQWVKLTPVDGEFVIFNPCNATNTTLFIEKHNKDYSLTIEQGTKTFKLDILDARMLSDTLHLTAKWPWSKTEKRKQIQFVWDDKTQQVGRWIMEYSGGFTLEFVYVTKDRISGYTVVNEPCKVCWGEACDEVLAKKSS